MAKCNLHAFSNFELLSVSHNITRSFVQRRDKQFYVGSIYVTVPGKTDLFQISRHWYHVDRAIHSMQW